MAWLPLESNPDVMNLYLEKLGIPEQWKIVDVYGLEGEALAWVPRPALSVILLFPCSDQHEQHTAQQAEEIKAKGQIVSPKVYFVKQVVHNACGTIALLHSVANNLDKIKLKDGPPKDFIEESLDMDPKKRGDLLHNAAGIINAHREIALQGQTEAPEPSSPVNHHFVAFVHVDGSLYELDGRKDFPINHGPTTPETLVEDAAKVCREYIDRDPSDVRFTVVALAAAAD